MRESATSTSYNYVCSARTAQPASQSLECKLTFSEITLPVPDSQTRACKECTNGIAVG